MRYVRVPIEVGSPQRLPRSRAGSLGLGIILSTIFFSGKILILGDIFPGEV
jgi:hypothetical protein